MVCLGMSGLGNSTKVDTRIPNHQDLNHQDHEFRDTHEPGNLIGNFSQRSLKLFSDKSLLQDVIFDFASIFWIGNVWKPCKCEPSSAVFLGINGINFPHFRPGQTSKPLKSKVRNQAVNLFERIWPLDLNHWNMWGEKGR